MQSGNLLNINLASVAEAAEGLDVELTDRFFADLEQEEISGGELHAHIVVRASAGDIFKVKVQVEGFVTVPCDRCLDPLRLEVDVEDEVKVKDADPAENDDVELLYMDKGSRTFDLSWSLYEIIETSLPIHRAHPEGECNADMVSYIISSNEEDADDE